MESSNLIQSFKARRMYDFHEEHSCVYRDYMMGAYALIESTLGEGQASALSLCWDGIGGWNGATGGIQFD